MGRKPAPLRVIIKFDQQTGPVAQTYIFLDDVITQTGAGMPTNWGHTSTYHETDRYEMDPDVVARRGHGPCARVRCARRRNVAPEQRSS